MNTMELKMFVIDAVSRSLPDDFDDLKERCDWAFDWVMKEAVMKDETSEVTHLRPVN